ncbi:DUF4256 family protein [Flavobacterium sp. TP390]|uniref:DUF4256 family protein n=1 Tax=Flavobacterium profundi TaxID=1774945 RepID=A0A6I4IU04_9FLAO|nr:DUF4256 domain-containing protein [Flavobacterium profundi]MVO10350.1 DUF4256 family protein [Flavobacterium profundi]
MSFNKEQQEELLQILKKRFDKNKQRHKGMAWQDVQDKLAKNPQKCIALQAMESTGGEPDVVAFDTNTKEFIFFDCAAESPKGRRSVCYDKEALDARKEFKPKHNAIDMALEMGIEILDEEQYHFLQKLGDFDQKTSSWLKTPNEIRKLGGAIFGDFRYNHVFIYHNGAQSYYAARGFRGYLKV